MSLSSNLLAGKKGLIMGVANERSIAWGIAKECAANGAELAFSYQGEVLKTRVEPLAAEVNSTMLLECDVRNQSSVDRLFEGVQRAWGKLDFLVHAIGFSDKNELQGRYVDTSVENFLMTMDISCYSFTRIAKMASTLMTEGGSMITLTYYGAEKVCPNYNVMGVAKAALEASVRYIAVDLGSQNIRINAISAGPIKTLAASGIADFRSSLKWNEANSPLKRNVTQEDIGKSALYLLSNLSSGVTGEIIHVDSGYHVTGMKMHHDE